MGLVRFLWFVTLATLVVPLRRLRRGPLRPTWTLRQEVVVDAMRRNGKYMMSVSPGRARRHLASLARPVRSSAVLLEPADVDGLRGLWFRPRSGGARGVLLYFIGGGYVLGAIESYRATLAKLAESAGVAVLAVEYRQAPERAFPAAVEDCVRAYRWLRATSDAPDRIVIGGDSAGGGLALAVLITLRDAGEARPAGAALISPWVDLAAGSPSVTANAPYDWGDREYLLHWARLYVDDDEARHPLASPLHADLAALSPLLILVGGAELLRDEVLQIAERAEQVGNAVTLRVYPDMIHGWQLMGDVFAQGDEALGEIGDFVRRCSA